MNQPEQRQHSSDANQTSGEVNPGVIEETGSTARTLIQGLSSAPMILAVLVFNIIYMAGTFYTQSQAAERWSKIAELAFKACPTNTNYKLQSDDSKPFVFSPETPDATNPPK
jgi:hypothetical protein